MDRKPGCMSLILTLNEANKDISDKEAETAAKRLLSALRRKAGREDWKYYIVVGFSRSDQKVKRERAHFHIFLYADPCETVARWINDYWNPARKSRREGRGIVRKQRIEQKKAGYFVDGYIRGQAVFTREQKRAV